MCCPVIGKVCAFDELGLAMQDNEPLMRALAKLINLNEPDLVLFVGEALVGNDAVDQLTKFNQVSRRGTHNVLRCKLNSSCLTVLYGFCRTQKLVDFSTKANPRLIDGILLTKFDTIDDKVSRHTHSCL